MNKEAKTNVLIAVCLATVIALMMFMTSFSFVNADTTAATPSNVTVTEYIAISASTNLTKGILFGSAAPTTLNNNATGNHDNGAGYTTMWLNVSTDSNANVDFCIKDSVPLTKGGFNIPNTNYTYAGNVTVDATNMAEAPSIAITTGYIGFGNTAVVAGSGEYFMAWLDIPTGQSPGDYANTVTFKGIITGGAC